MASFKECEDALKAFMISEQQDAHHVKSMNTAKYNNIKLWMDVAKNQTPHIYVRISISEAVFSLDGFNKLNGGLGYEERLVLKWFGRYGVKQKLMELWNSAEKSESKEESKK